MDGARERLHGGLRVAADPLVAAGHPLPVLVSGDEDARYVGAPGTLVGVVDDPEVTPVAIALRPGDTLVLYTDGATEARAADGALFGDARLLEALSATGGAGGGVGGDAKAAVQALAGAVHAFGVAGASGDDLAILAVAVPRRL